MTGYADLFITRASQRGIFQDIFTWIYYS